jgi:hypothetical protein
MKRKVCRQTKCFENDWLRAKLAEKWKEHGGTRAQFLRDIGFMGKLRRNGEIHLSYLLNGKRGLNFVKAVRLATAAGIELAELQQLILNGASTLCEAGSGFGNDTES